MRSKEQKKSLIMYTTSQSSSKSSSSSSPTSSLQSIFQRPPWPLILWISIQIMVFMAIWANYKYTADYSKMRLLFYDTFPIARAAAGTINVNLALILLSACFKLQSMLRNTMFRLLGRCLIPDTIQMHKWAGASIVAMTAIHVTAHLLNFQTAAVALGPEISFEKLWFLSGPGWTGQLALMSLLFIAITSLNPKIRKIYFEVFFGTHHLFVVFISALLAHGSFCFLRADNEPYCRGPSTWKYLLVPAILYIIDRGWRECTSKATINKVVIHPGNVLELQFDCDWLPMAKKNGWLPGSHVRIKCPMISRTQWHPFGIASDVDEAYITVFIHVVGDWTRQLKQQFENYQNPSLNHLLPTLHVDGPYSSPFEAIWKQNVAVLVAGGIGATPFASIVKRLEMIMQRGECLGIQKVYLIWICRDVGSFKWFQGKLLEMEQSNLTKLVDLKLYWTVKSTSIELMENVAMHFSEQNDVLTGLQQKTCFGRPLWNRLLPQIHSNHPRSKIGVFVCGPEAMVSEIRRASCSLNRQVHSTIFTVHSESF